MKSNVTTIAKLQMYMYNWEDLIYSPDTWLRQIRSDCVESDLALNWIGWNVFFFGKSPVASLESVLITPEVLS